MNFDSLKDQVSNLTLYDLKAGVRKVQNAVMNYTEMEAKVREATNNEPWGASSTMMQEIANGTFNYQLLNEIMPMIYKRFTEKSAEEWRQIYKALQLLEFLVKNGSERVIDDVRGHLSLLKMLRQFHYIDQNGKDQGINVRNRSKELTELLSDVDRIRSERKKARANKTKYSGVEGGAGLGGGMSSRYGGFGSETGAYGGATRTVYGDGGGFGGEVDDYDEGAGSTSRGGSGGDRFDEYDEYDEGAVAAPGRRKADVHRSTTRNSTASTSASSAATAKKALPKPKEPEVDLFDFGDEPVTSTAPLSAAPSNGKAPAAGDAFGALESAGADDDFDDFQSAAPAPAPQMSAAPAGGFGAIPPPINTSATPIMSPTIAAPQPRQGTQTAAFSNLFSTASPTSSTTTTPAPSLLSQAQQPRPMGYQPTGPNYFTSVAAQPSGSAPSTPSAQIGAPKPKPKPAAGGGDAFAALLSGTGFKKTNSQPTTKGPTLADMAKQKSSAGIWGASAATPPAQTQYGAPRAPQKTGGAMDDLLG